MIFIDLVHTSSLKGGFSIHLKTSDTRIDAVKNRVKVILLNIVGDTFLLGEIHQVLEFSSMLSVIFSKAHAVLQLSAVVAVGSELRVREDSSVD